MSNRNVSKFNTIQHLVLYLFVAPENYNQKLLDCAFLESHVHRCSMRENSIRLRPFYNCLFRWRFIIHGGIDGLIRLFS